MGEGCGGVSLEWWGKGRKSKGIQDQPAHFIHVTAYTPIPLHPYTGYINITECTYRCSSSTWCSRSSLWPNNAFEPNGTRCTRLSWGTTRSLEMKGWGEKRRRGRRGKRGRSGMRGGREEGGELSEPGVQVYMTYRSSIFPTHTLGS